MKKYRSTNGTQYYIQRDEKGVYRGWGTIGHAIWEDLRICRARTQKQAEHNLAMFAAKHGLMEVPVQ